LADLREELQAIYDRRGQLTPALVVEEARPLQHPLHDRFEWDDAKAGEEWRRSQAHRMIQSVRITYAHNAATGEPQVVRAWHAVSTPAGHIYEPADRVARDPLLVELVKRDMERDWVALRARYEQFDEFWRMISAEVPQITQG
jgi:hypothetical protein